MDYIQSLDEKFLLLINGMNNKGLDQLFFWISEKWIWVPLYIYLFVLYYKNFPGKIVFVIVAVALLILLSDQIASHVLKSLVMRPRPCHEPHLADKIHLVNGYCGSSYGFVSSHAANSFALATFFYSTLGKKNSRLAWGLFIWASFVGFSRIYLGVHFPTDIICGALVGVGCALLIQKIFKAKITG